MANVYKVCITLTHFGTFEPPLGAPKGPFHEQNKQLSMVIRWPKLTKFGPEYPYWYSGPIWAWWSFKGPKCHIWDYLEPENGLFCSWKGPLGAPRGGPKGPKMGQWYIPCKHWPFDPLCGVWNQIWCHTRLPEGTKEPVGGIGDPSWPPPGPPKPCPDPQTPPKALLTPPLTPLTPPLAPLTTRKCKNAPKWKTAQNWQKWPKMAQKWKL